MNLYFMAMVLDDLLLFDLVFYKLVLYDLIAPLVLIYAPVGEKQMYLVTNWKLKKILISISRSILVYSVEKSWKFLLKNIFRVETFHQIVIFINHLCFWRFKFDVFLVNFYELLAGGVWTREIRVLKVAAVLWK